ncbi:hypothetical protein K435DRAFT_853720 [Dendrothele bispora CBS 962.96]|uniref:Uncharacterized protein n=1 Tax=Dendrothele bispora (strain CBS 962.96) TaxID=1314807 RepID=A0A4S8MFT2_DENBC|nr:hypothetical protein K435DRAFT_853720 [Dendrothele bispora CBS 962.96]
MPHNAGISFVIGFGFGGSGKDKDKNGNENKSDRKHSRSGLGIWIRVWEELAHDPRVLMNGNGFVNGEKEKEE